MHKTSLYTHIEIIKTAPLVVEQIILHRQGTADEYRLEITAPLVVEQIAFIWLHKKKLYHIFSKNLPPIALLLKVRKTIMFFKIQLHNFDITKLKNT